MYVYYISISGSTVTVRFIVIADSPLLLVRQVKGLVLIIDNTYLSKNFNSYIPSLHFYVGVGNIGISFNIPSELGSDLNEKCLLGIYQIYLPFSPSVYNLTFSLVRITSTVVSVDGLANIWILCMAQCDHFHYFSPPNCL